MGWSIPSFGDSRSCHDGRLSQLRRVVSLVDTADQLSIFGIHLCHSDAFNTNLEAKNDSGSKQHGRHSTNLHIVYFFRPFISVLLSLWTVLSFGLLFCFCLSFSFDFVLFVVLFLTFFRPLSHEVTFFVSLNSCLLFLLSGFPCLLYTSYLFLETFFFTRSPLFFQTCFLFLCFLGPFLLYSTSSFFNRSPDGCLFL